MGVINGRLISSLPTYSSKIMCMSIVLIVSKQIVDLTDSVLMRERPLEIHPWVSRPAVEVRWHVSGCYRQGIGPGLGGRLGWGALFERDPSECTRARIAHPI